MVGEGGTEGPVPWECCDLFRGEGGMDGGGEVVRLREELRKDPRPETEEARESGGEVRDGSGGRGLRTSEGP